MLRGSERSHERREQTEQRSDDQPLSFAFVVCAVGSRGDTFDRIVTGGEILGADRIRHADEGRPIRMTLRESGA